MIEIINYEDKYADDFKRLNVEWLEKFDVMESYDLDVLDHPHEKILDNGGYIFLAKSEDKIIGTAGLMKLSDTEYELVKMSVTPAFQGKGIGKILMDKCIEIAKKLNAKKLILYSNSKLKSAINLYKKYGFIFIPEVDSPLLTVDVKMELTLIA